MSVNGSDTVPWPSLDPKTFATNVQTLAEDWSLDGIDLDNETVGEIPGTQFVELIQAVRDTMGAQFIITYPAFLTYRDAFLPQVKDALSYVMTMAYWNEANVAESLYEEYAKMVGPEKVMMGIKPGYDYSNQSTPIDAVVPICQYEPTGAQKAGIMLYSLSIDIPQYTQQKQFYWTELVNTNLPRAKQALGR
jgi:glycosyl hydrolase family 18 (putative chitinase)